MWSCAKEFWFCFTAIFIFLFVVLLNFFCLPLLKLFKMLRSSPDLLIFFLFLVTTQKKWLSHLVYINIHVENVLLALKAVLTSEIILSWNMASYLKFNYTNARNVTVILKQKETWRNTFNFNILILRTSKYIIAENAHLRLNTNTV